MIGRDVYDPNPYGAWTKRRMYMKAEGARCGIMLCSNCGKPIASGWYSVKQNPEGEYRAHLHRACSEDDLQWQVIDAHHAQQEEIKKDFIEDCKLFRDKWGIDDLDHYIEGVK